MRSINHEIYNLGWEYGIIDGCNVLNSKDRYCNVMEDRDGVKCESGWSDFYGSIKCKTVQLYDAKKPSKFAKQNRMIICFVIVELSVGYPPCIPPLELRRV